MRPILQRHSTLFGFAAALLAGLIIAASTRLWVAALLTFLAILVFAPRLFYGRKESRALDAERVASDSVDNAHPHDMAGIGLPAYRLDRAYRDAMPGLRCDGMPPDDREFRALAQEEEE